jgi:hypothetical protein
MTRNHHAGGTGRGGWHVGNCLYWLSIDGDVLEFDLGEPSLTVIRGPLDTDDISILNPQIIQAENGVVGYANLSYLCFQMWQRNINGHGVATWLPWKTIEMDTILNPPPPTKYVVALLVGYDDDSDILFLSVRGDIYTVQLNSMQSTKLYEGINTYGSHALFLISKCLLTSTYSTYQVCLALSLLSNSLCLSRMTSSHLSCNSCCNSLLARITKQSNSSDVWFLVATSLVTKKNLSCNSTCN